MIVILVAALGVTVSTALVKSGGTTIIQTVTNISGGTSISSSGVSGSIASSETSAIAGNSASTSNVTLSSTTSIQSQQNFTLLSLWCQSQSEKYSNAVANASGNPVIYSNVSLFAGGGPGGNNASLLSIDWQVNSAQPLYCLNVFVNGAEQGYAQATQSNNTGPAGTFAETPVENVTVIANRTYNVTLTALLPNAYYVTAIITKAVSGYPS